MLPMRLRRVVGYEGRLNDVLFHPPSRFSINPNTLVFFGGDVQDYPELMQTHKDNLSYLKWNLENMARMLSRNFPYQHILVIRPSRIEYKSFSCYDNFVPSNNAGVPDHTPNHKALHHLERLIQNVCSRVKSLPNSDLMEAVAPTNMPEVIDIEELRNSTLQLLAECEPNKPNVSTKTDAPSHVQGTSGVHKPVTDPLWWRYKMALDDTQLTLIGFSKGCVVLNQMIYEFHYTKTLTPGDMHMFRFIQRIENMYWLDGGHAGGKNTWITSRSLLETLSRLNINIYIHVSPYQVRDEGRPWIGKEERAFTSLLKKLGAKIHRYMHDQSELSSLEGHFEVLADFKEIQDSTAVNLPESSDEET